MSASEFTAETDAILDRLAAAVADSSESPAGACGVDWCNRDLAGASFTTVWRSFSTWIGAPPPDTTPPETTHRLRADRDGHVDRRRRSSSRRARTGSSFECALDFAAFAQCDSPRSTPASDRPPPLRGASRRPAGNADPTPATADWTVAPVDEGRPHAGAAGRRPPARTIPLFAPPPGPRVPPPVH